MAVHICTLVKPKMLLIRESYFQFSNICLHFSGDCLQTHFALPTLDQICTVLVLGPLLLTTID